MNNITTGLMSLGHRVTVLTIFTHKHPLTFSELPASYSESTNIQGVFVDTEINLADAFSSLITRDSYNVSRFFSTDFDIRLTRILRKEKFDVIHLESLFMTPYIATCRRNSSAKIVLRSHNLEFVIWERIAGGTKNLARRTYIKYLSKKLREYELSVLDQVDGIAAISSADKTKYESLGISKPIVTIPFGIDLDNYELDEKTAPELALFHLGSMDWMPNLEAVLWFLDDVWPLVNKAQPNLKLYLAGRQMPEDLKSRSLPNLEIVGEVENAKSFMRSKAIMVVPLLSASGIRVKIIEGMALGKAIVSTSIGGEGIDYTDGVNIQIADTPAQFVEKIKLLCNSAALLDAQGKEARKLVEAVFDNRVLSQNLVDFYKFLGQ